MNLIFHWAILGMVNGTLILQPADTEEWCRRAERIPEARCVYIAEGFHTVYANHVTLERGVWKP
jgi:hypothetical protein